MTLGQSSWVLLARPRRTEGRPARVAADGQRAVLTTKLRVATRRLGLMRFGAEVLALAGAVLAVDHADRLVALTFSAIALVVVVVRGVKPLRRAAPIAVAPTGTSIMVRILVVLAVVASFSSAGRWPATVVLLVTLLTERWIAPLARSAVPYAQNLPGIRVRNRAAFGPKWIFAVNCAGLVAFSIAVALRAPNAVTTTVAVTVLLPSVVAFADAALRVLGRYRAERLLPAALGAYGPTFGVHWYAPTGSQQLAMWLPYLERLGRPFVIVLRNAATFDEICAQTTRPVLVRRYRSEIDAVVVPGLKTVFFVNTSPKNADILQYLELNQIQLNHGDSDKTTSYRRLFRLYDKNFVAGQAAVDRFAQHGVEVPRQAFEIVGRPQVEAITVADRRRRTGPVTVLYAPTWFGFLDDSRYSSLPLGHDIVSALLTRGCTVIFRPHPWARRNREFAQQIQRIEDLLRRDREGTGRPHTYGRGTEVHASLVDCFNEADALISDVSSVVVDFLYSEKPFAVTQMQPDLSEEDVASEFPLAAGGYLLWAGAPTDDSALDDLLHHDPRAESRRALKSYYLGDFDTENYADAFLGVARRYV